ncbi:hypothetical protein DET48_10932 [Vibrio diazotrophicus]|jgi:hypothetical protein|uniref:Uncharacterized protein n=1 Tax=Vibrio diazotrophicus TaxID=685 RepID=A0A329EBV2_VIBDI|nr:hypothetical protein DET48_10932 [Vibrio diazotrophicus]
MNIKVVSIDLAKVFSKFVYGNKANSAFLT